MAWEFDSVKAGSGHQGPRHCSQLLQHRLAFTDRGCLFYVLAFVLAKALACRSLLSWLLPLSPTLLAQ